MCTSLLYFLVKSPTMSLTPIKRITGFMNGTTFGAIGVLSPPEEAGLVLGWSSAIASYGAFIIPVMFGISLKAGAPEVT